MTTVKEIADEIVALQSRKNADYGNAFGISMQEFGLTAPAIRLTDKLNRFKSLIKKEAEVKSESIEDTLIDLAAYAMMTVAEMRNGKKAESEISKILKRGVPNFNKELDYDGRVSSGVAIPGFIEKVLEDFRIGDVMKDGNGEDCEVLDLEFIPKINIKRLKDGSQSWILLRPKDDETR